MIGASDVTDNTPSNIKNLSMESSREEFSYFDLSQLEYKVIENDVNKSFHLEKLKRNYEEKEEISSVLRNDIIKLQMEFEKLGEEFDADLRQRGLLLESLVECRELKNSLRRESKDLEDLFSKTKGNATLLREDIEIYSEDNKKTENVVEVVKTEMLYAKSRISGLFKFLDAREKDLGIAADAKLKIKSEMSQTSTALEVAMDTQKKLTYESQHYEKAYKDLFSKWETICKQFDNLEASSRRSAQAIQWEDEMLKESQTHDLTIKKLNDELESKLLELENIKGDFAKIQAQHLESLNRIKEMEESECNMVDELHNLIEENNGLVLTDDSLKELEEELKSAESAVVILEQKSTNLKLELANVRFKVAMLEENLKVAENEIADIESERNKEKKDLQSISEEFFIQLRKKEEIQSLIVELQNKIKSFEANSQLCEQNYLNEVKDKEQEIVAAQNTLTLLNEKFNLSNHELNHIRSLRSRHLKTIRELQTELNDLVTDETGLRERSENEFNVQRDTLATLNATRKIKEDVINKLKTALKYLPDGEIYQEENVKKEIATLKKDIENAKMLLLEKVEMKKKTSLEMEQLENQIMSMLKEKDKLVVSYEKDKITLDELISLQTELSMLRSKVCERRSELDRFKETSSMEVQRLKNEKELLENELKDIERDIENILNKDKASQGEKRKISTLELSQKKKSRQDYYRARGEKIAEMDNLSFPFECEVSIGDKFITSTPKSSQEILQRKAPEQTVGRKRLYKHTNDLLNSSDNQD